MAQSGSVDDRAGGGVRHLAGCPTCRFLAADGAPVAQALAGSAPPAPAADLAALESALMTRVEAERGPLAAARVLSRPVRLAIVASVMVLGALAYYLHFSRKDWADYPALRMALTLASFAGLGSR